jgi:Lon-like ATP-dependent protease
MTSDYKANDYEWIKELLDYPRTLEERLNFFEDTSQIAIPEDPIDRVIFQDCAKQGTHSYGGKAGNR